MLVSGLVSEVSSIMSLWSEMYAQLLYYLVEMVHLPLQ